MITEKHDCKTSPRREIILSEEHNQYSRIECALCGRWITWGRSPTVTLEHEQRKQLINNLLQLNILTDWQKEFLQNIYDRRVLIGKQQESYENIIHPFKKLLFK